MRRWILCALVACLAACVGTRTGNPDIGSTSTGTNTGTGELAGGVGNCDADEKPLASLDQQTSLGISAADVLAFASGAHATSIRWQASEIAQFAPESGEHALSITLTPGPAAFFVKYTEKTAQSDSSGGGLAIATPYTDCSALDAVEIPVVVEIKSDGSALDEKLKGKLRATDKLWASLHLDLKADQLGGELELVSTMPAGFNLVQLAIDLGFSPLGLRGSLSGVLEMRTKDSVTQAGGASTSSVGASGGAFALIGADASCDEAGLPIELDHALQGFSMQDALDLVASTSTLAGIWQDGHSGSFTLGLELEPGAVACALLDKGQAWEITQAGTLRMRTTLALASDDRRLDAHWPVVLDASPADDGSLHDVTITLDLEKLGPPSAAALEPVYGLHGVDASSYDGVQVMMQLQVNPGEPAASVTGSFKATGLKFADCAAQNTPAQPTPGGEQGGSSPGCKGADLIELESVTW